MIAQIKHTNSKAQRFMPKPEWEEFRNTEAGKVYRLVKYIGEEAYESQGFVFPEQTLSSDKTETKNKRASAKAD